MYRAIDHDGNLVDSMLSEKRNMEAAQRFFLEAIVAVGHTPESVTTDGHRSYPRAISETMCNHIQHRTSKYLNNRLEQNHRGIRTAILSHAWIREQLKRRHVSVVTRDELQNYFRQCLSMGESVSLPERRVFLDRLVALQALLQAAS